MSRLAQQERHALADTLLAVGPDAPTMCEGWLARDLATHLVVRDRRPDAQVSMLVPALRGHAEQVQSAVAATPWEALVTQVRSGPPAWSPARLGPVDELMNTAEFYVHHEDLLRAQPGWAARPVGPELTAALWRSVRVVGRVALRQSPVGVELVAPGHGRQTVRRGHPVVRAEAAPGELLLFAFGRRAVARVDLDGPNAAVEQLRAAPSGI